MKSASLAAALLTVVPTPVGAAVPKEQSGESFDAALEEAIAPIEEEQPAAVEEKKKPEADPALITCVAYFCPPPVLEPIQLTSTPAAKVIADEETTESDSQVAENFNAPTTSQAILDMVSPKAATEGAFKLDSKLFKPVAPAETEAPPPTPAAHGTVVAQLDNRVKNSGKTTEIAPPIEQKMPVREVSRRPVVEAPRVEAFQSEQQTSHILEADFAAASEEIIPVKSLDAAALVETIRTEVTSLRQRGDATMTVVLRPDSGTQLSLDVSISRDGTVHAQARFERGDFQTLNAQWSQLQHSLAAHGIRVADLSNQNNFQQHQQHSSADQFQNFDRGQNPHQREEREVLNFEEQFTASRSKPPFPKPQPATASIASSPRYWQSWA